MNEEILTTDMYTDPMLEGLRLITEMLQVAKINAETANEIATHKRIKTQIKAEDSLFTNVRDVKNMYISDVRAEDIKSILLHYIALEGGAYIHKSDIDAIKQMITTHFNK